MVLFGLPIKKPFQSRLVPYLVGLGPKRMCLYPSSNKRLGRAHQVQGPEARVRVIEAGRCGGPWRTSAGCWRRLHLSWSLQEMGFGRRQMGSGRIEETNFQHVVAAAFWKWILDVKMFFLSTKGAWWVGPRESETEREWKLPARGDSRRVGRCAAFTGKIFTSLLQGCAQYLQRPR